jgi:alkylation response protein AidB-like acyl-CoA dehydrogenase
MMNFELNEEQLQIKYSIREFAESEILPHVMEWDETQHFPEELRPKLAELGLMGVLFPEEYGGSGMGYVEYATIIEELGRVCGSVGLSVAAHNSLCSNHLYMFGSEEQKKNYLVPLAQGESWGAWGLTESQAGSDSAGTRTNAVRSNGGWKVNGSKNFITHAIACNTLVAVAVTDKSKGNRGISAFVFDKSMEGFRSDKKENKLGMRASETASVVFEDCYVPRGKPPRQPRRRIFAVYAGPGRRPNFDRGTFGRHCAGCIRSGSQIFKGKAAIRKADLGISGDTIQACRHGDADRMLAASYTAGCCDEGRGQNSYPKIRDGETIRFGNCCPRF